MNNMRRGFTMIELIFVIVIIGILAAVAIPKLNATRDDAKISKIVANVRTFVEDTKNFYTAQGQTIWQATATAVTTVTDVPLFTDTACNTIATSGTQIAPTAGLSLYLCGDNGDVVQFDINGTGITVLNGADTTSNIGLAVQNDNAFVGLRKVHNIGGTKVQR